MVALQGIAAARQRMLIVLRLEDKQDIFDAYGKDIEKVIRDALLERLLHYGISLSSISSSGSDFIVSPLLLPGLCASSSLDREIERLRSALTREPISHGLWRIYVSLVSELIDAATAELEAVATTAIASGSDVWVQSFLNHFHDVKRDIAVSDRQFASALIDDLKAGRLVLAFQAITSSMGAADGDFYSEALLRRLSDDGLGTESCALALQSAERVGLIGRIDVGVVWTIVNQLAINPNLRLGCNVSARTLESSYGWAALLEYLGTNRSVATRLTLEVTETSVLERAVCDGRIMNVLREYGVTFAVDDFGAGHSSMDLLSKGYFHIAKIDGEMVRLADADESKGELLKNLVGYCACFAPGGVIVEGIETAAQHGIAVASGAQGLQGYYVGGPTISPPWANELHVVVVEGD